MKEGRECVGTSSEVEKLVGFVAPNNCPLQLVQDLTARANSSLVWFNSARNKVSSCS